MTLIELLMSIAISTVIIGAAAMSLIVGLRISSATADSFAESNDAELISTYFVPDAQSASAVGPTLATGCSAESSADLVRMTSPVFAVGYRLDGSQLRRWICQGGTTTSRVLARNLEDVLAWSNGGHQVALTVLAASGHAFTIIATQRTGTVDLPLSTGTNAPPVAVPSVSCSHLTCQLDGAGSTDPDGSIVAYLWDLGDGTTSTAETFDHTYATAGTFTVRLTVTDDRGTFTTSTATASTAANQTPTASFTATCTGKTCTVDGTGSADPDGAITGLAWDWGDSTTADTGATATHTYTTSGTKTITLAVTDDDGAIATTTRSVRITGAPTVSFTVDTCNLAVCSVSATASTDGGGTIVSYDWSWGDATTGTGATASHGYAALGQRTISVTVTDSDGATATATAVVTPPVLTFTAALVPTNTVTLSWLVASLTGNVDVYRNNTVVASNITNLGTYVRSNNAKGQVNGTYKVCERGGTQRCTNAVAVAL